jgi:glycerophosphoryl diester phosphodiesterase
MPSTCKAIAAREGWRRKTPCPLSRPRCALQTFDVGRIRPDTAYAARFRDQRGMDNVRIPALTDVFDLVKRLGADHVRFNIETKITPDSGNETPPPEVFAAMLAKAVRDAGLASRVSVQSFDWRTLKAMQTIAPEIERVCLTIETLTEDNIRRGKASPWTAGLRIDNVAGSVPRLVKAADCAVWSPFFRNLTAAQVREAHGLGLKVIPWTVNDMDALTLMIETGIDGIITDYPDRGRAALPKNVTPPPPVRAR